MLAKKLILPEQNNYKLNLIYYAKWPLMAKKNLMWLSYTDPTTWGEAVPTCVVSSGGGYCGGVRHGRGIHSDYLLPRTVQLHAREFHWERSALWEELYCVYTQLPVLRHQWNYTEIRSIACQSKTYRYYLCHLSD